MSPSVSITPRGIERIRDGHPWVYRSDLTRIDAGPGDMVRVVDARGRHVASALYSDRSQIAIRVVSRGAEEFSDDSWRQRLRRAIRFRESLAIDSNACRLVHGEGDRLPSLVIDRYGEFVVVQTLSQGSDRLLPVVVDTLLEELAPKGILARNDPRVRLLEGLERKVEILHGDVPAAVDVTEGGVVFEADLWHGQKTGLFLDQRENRSAAAGYARGRLLDCFSYNGGFALRLASRCVSTLAIDSAENAAERIAINARRNGVAVEVRSVNVFDELRELDRADERFDTIVLDPPAFAKNKDALAKALTGYKEINLRALKILNPGGTLITCTCSYQVSEAMFADVLLAAAVDAGLDVAVVEKRMQARDHPVLLSVPETYYLKCFILRRLG